MYCVAPTFYILDLKTFCTIRMEILFELDIELPGLVAA